MARIWFGSQSVPTGRLEAFSDGVLAVAITLLALDLKLPYNFASDDEIWRAALGLMPSFAAWIVSFAFLMTIWINHHYLFEGVNAVDRGLLWLNGFFLLTITLLPLPTGLVGAYPGRAAPLALLSATMFFSSLSFTLMRLYLFRRPELAKASVSPVESRIGLTRSAIGPLIYAVAFAMSFVAPFVAIGCQIAALLLFIFGPPNFSRSGRPA